jgi:hypothetical protein
MILARNVGLMIAALALGALGAGEAHAQVGGAPAALGYAFFGNGLYNSYDRPPYYAMFPPVYYSYPVARAYGYSPFAYPPGFTTPEGEPVQAKEVINPFVPRKAVKPATDRTALAPQLLINPFVERRPSAALAARAPFDAAE